MVKKQGSKRYRKRKGNRKGSRRSRMTANASHLRAQGFKNSLLMRLKWADDQTITVLSSWRFGLAQFWNQKPGYYDEYMKIYKMSRITSVKVKVTVINTTANTPAEVALCVLPYSDYSKTLAQVKQLPKAKYRYLSGSGGIDKVSLSYSANLNNWLAVDSRSIRDYQQSASEAASTLALLPDTPVLALYVGGASTEPTLRVFIEVIYDVEFFEPEYPGSVAVQTGNTPKDMTDSQRCVQALTRERRPSITSRDDDDMDWDASQPDDRGNSRLGGRITTDSKHVNRQASSKLRKDR